MTILIIGMLLLKAFIVLSGFASIYLGYRLFMAGVVAKAGDLDFTIKGFTLALGKAAPGTFFAVLGAGIIVSLVFQGLSFESEEGNFKASKPSDLRDINKELKTTKEELEKVKKYIAIQETAKQKYIARQNDARKEYEKYILANPQQKWHPQERWPPVWTSDGQNLPYAPYAGIPWWNYKQKHQPWWDNEQNPKPEKKK